MKQYPVQARTTHTSLHLLTRQHLLLGIVPTVVSLAAIAHRLPAGVGAGLSFVLLGQLLHPQCQTVVLLAPEPPQLLLGGVDGDMRDHILLGPASPSGHMLVTLHLKMLQHAPGLHSSKIPSKHAVHGLELGNLLVPETTCADTDPQAEGTKSILPDVLLPIGIFQTAETVLPTTDILII